MATGIPSTQPVPNTTAVTKPAAVSLLGVAKALVQFNVISDKKAQEYQSRAQNDKMHFMEVLSREDKQASRKAAQELAKAFELPLMDLDILDPESIPSGALDDLKKIGELRAVPVYARGPKMFIAVSDPTNSAGPDFYTHKSGKKAELVIVDDASITAFIEGLSGKKSDGVSEIPDEDLNFDLEDGGAEQETVEADIDDEGDGSPVVKLVKGIILTAIKKGASDIHFEPYEKFYRVRLRVDGALQELTKPPAKYSNYIASRIKVISGLNIAEKRVPQDGRMKMKLPGGRAIDFRVSTCPVMYGEKIVMRILDPSSAKLGIDALGYEPEEKQRLMDAIHRPYGMVLVTGPTGSGKTVSLYTCLNILNREDINISTAEDPAEIQLPGINQVNVNPAQGLTFAAALKSFLRQDPDIVMVGEIRDEETAEISVKAAQTGHLVLATLHTNDAPKTVARLMEIGVKPYNVAGAVILITAQRLARKLCEQCKVPHNDLTPKMLMEDGMTEDEANGVYKVWKPFKANPDGCSACNKGYKGRVGIYQVMPISEEIRKIVMSGGDSIAIAEQSRKEGVRDLRQSGLLKFRKGLTSLDEVLNCTNEE